jgi:stress response protein YsnF
VSSVSQDTLYKIRETATRHLEERLKREELRVDLEKIARLADGALQQAHAERIPWRER